MSDTSDWPNCVHVDRRPYCNSLTGEPYEGVFVDRIMVPLSEYQMGNLIDAVGQVQNNGDWWMETCYIVACGMRAAGLKQISSNRGHTFTLKDVETGNIRR